MIAVEATQTRLEVESRQMANLLLNWLYSENPSIALAAIHTHAKLKGKPMQEDLLARPKRPLSEYEIRTEGGQTTFACPCGYEYFHAESSRTHQAMKLHHSWCRA